MTIGTETDLRNEAFQLLVKLITRSDPGRLEIWAGLGLTMTQLRTLFLLLAEDGLSASGLAERLGVTPSTLTRIMDRLVANRLVCRESDEGDRRLVRHHLTQTGADTVTEIERTGRARMNDILSRLTPAQLKRAVEALRDLSAASDAVETAAPGGGR